MAKVTKKHDYRKRPRGVLKAQCFVEDADTGYLDGAIMDATVYQAGKRGDMHETVAWCSTVESAIVLANAMNLNIQDFNAWADEHGFSASERDVAEITFNHFLKSLRERTDA